MNESLFPDLGGSDLPADATVVPCPKTLTNWIDLEYLYADGTGVAGASYVVQRPNAGQVGGSVLAQGILDSKGRAHASLPIGVEAVEVYFHDDPLGEPYFDQDAGKPVKEPEPGFFERLWDGFVDGFVDVAKWLGGALAGDFVEDPSAGQIVVNTIVTMIPGIDQIGDARDIVANLKKLIWDRRYNDGWVWLSVLLCLIGLIPELGSLAKGIVKVVLKKASKLSELLEVFNYFKKGNAVRWLRKFVDKLPTEHATAAARKLEELLNRADSYLRKKRESWFTPNRFKPAIDRVLKNIEEIKKIAPEELKKAADYITEKIKKLLDEPIEVEPGSAKDKLKRQQVKTEPEADLPQPNVRPSKPSFIHGQSDGGPGVWGEPKTPRSSKTTKRSSPYQQKITGAPEGTEYLVPLERRKTGEVAFDGYDPARNTLLDAKEYKNYPPKDVKPALRDKMEKGIADEAAAQVEAAKGTPIEWHFPNPQKAAEVKKILSKNGVEGITIVVTP
jgi:restriction endonuclease fold toxin 5 of polymorphic toxin system